MSEQKNLNESLRSETKLYQNLRHIQNHRDRSENSDSLTLTYDIHIHSDICCGHLCETEVNLNCLCVLMCLFCRLNSSGDEKSDDALHAELNSLQTLRGQLEEVLARTRTTALALDRVTLTQMDYGGGTRQNSSVSVDTNALRTNN